MIALTNTLSHVLHTDYQLECPQTKRSTIKKMGGHVARWEELIPPCAPTDIDRPLILQFRAKCLELGLAPSTINSYVRTVTGLARIAGAKTELKRLKLTESGDALPTPSLDDLDRAWRVTTRLQWPQERRVNSRPVWCTIPRPLWWRALLITEFCTGLRRADLFGLQWPQVAVDRIPTINRKTGKTQYIPIPDPLRPWLDLLRRLGSELVFGCRHATQVDRELNRLAGLVGAPEMGLQAMRRRSSRAYDAAHAGAGKIILNHGKSVTESHYLASEETLQLAQSKLVYPPSFLERPSLDRQLVLF